MHLSLLLVNLEIESRPALLACLKDLISASRAKRADLEMTEALYQSLCLLWGQQA